MHMLMDRVLQVGHMHITKVGLHANADG
jgi:hypothetical protein